MLNVAKIGLLNFHPSLLPYNRGKHYYFWNIIEQVPFGVTLHLIDENIDKGKIIFQKKLNVSWLDNGNSLRERSKVAMLELFNENFENILNGRFDGVETDWSLGNIHYGKEIQEASKLSLNQTVLVKDLLNILRARSGFQDGGAWFEDNGKKYEVSINIKEV
jgi:methionyl-tRNA formyltransferase